MDDEELETDMLREKIRTKIEDIQELHHGIFVYIAIGEPHVGSILNAPDYIPRDAIPGILFDFIQMIQIVPGQEVPKEKF